jgi:Raf kinase inhibitor-like YbhB/YbcL family protein
MIIGAAFVLASATFRPNTTMPRSTVCTVQGGANLSPELHWRGAPKGTKSFALIVHDPDAPHPGGWYHWVLYGLPAGMHDLAAGAAPPPALTGINSSGARAYGGPCPPPGKMHHYVFTLYALDFMPALDKDLTAPQEQAAIARHVLASATLTGLFRR